MMLIMNILFMKVKVKSFFVYYLNNIMNTRNTPDWFPTDSDYELVFMEVKDPDGELRWREVSHNLEKYSNMLLADYLLHMGLYIPDFTQFIRIIDCDRNIDFEYCAFGGRVRIDVTTIL